MKLKEKPIRAKMRNYGMSDKQLSFETDIDTTTLHTILKGGKCSTRAAARIAVVLRLPLNSIVEV